MARLLNLLKNLFLFLLSMPKILIGWIIRFCKSSFNLIGYFFFLMAFFAFSILIKLTRRWSISIKLENLLNKIGSFNAPDENSIPRTELISLALRNMLSKKNRSLVTVGGMTIGIAAIVFLVSVGYGLQVLVIERVATLEEMRQTDISVLPGSLLILDDATLEEFSKIDGVEIVLPQIDVVGKINYKNSSTDTVAYGVTRDGLLQSSESPVLGEAFENNERETLIAAIKEPYYETIEDDPLPDEYITGDWIELEGVSDADRSIRTYKAIFPEEFKDRYAVVSRSFLNLFSIPHEDGIGEVFSVSFISVIGAADGIESRMESSPVEYTIVGVTPDDETPKIFVPLVHLKSLGVDNYSQVKVVSETEEDLAGVRSIIESQGYSTASVADTVEQINNLFATVRTILLLFGILALFVAALGMFNTLTVSLLERTREVGLLKSMGMKSGEIQELFLAESMIMGSMGGFFGISFGFLFGKIIERAFSIYAINRGFDPVTIISLPLFFIISVICLSFLVGILTGIYPSYRAKKISALNALRYE